MTEQTPALLPEVLVRNVNYAGIAENLAGRYRRAKRPPCREHLGDGKPAAIIKKWAFAIQPWQHGLTDEERALVLKLLVEKLTK